MGTNINSSIQMPETGFLRLPQVLHYIPVGKSTWWAGVKSGRFPKGYILGPKTTAWKVEDILALLASFEQDSAQENSHE